MEDTVTAVRTTPQEWVKIWEEAEAADVPIPLSYRLETFDGKFVDFPINTLGKSAFKLTSSPPNFVSSGGLKEFGKSLDVNNAYKAKGTLSTGIKMAISKR